MPDRRWDVLFCVTWQFTDQGEESEKRSLAVFSQWQIPQGVDVKGFYGYADASGGVMIAEVDSAATLARMTAPWAPWLTFVITPIVPIEESAAIAGEAIAFRDSVS